MNYRGERWLVVISKNNKMEGLEELVEVTEEGGGGGVKTGNIGGGKGGGCVRSSKIIRGCDFGGARRE